MIIWLIVSFVAGYALAIAHWWLLAGILCSVGAYILGAANATREMRKQIARSKPNPTPAAEPKSKPKPSEPQPADGGSLQDSLEKAPTEDAIKREIKKEQRTHARLVKNR